MQAIRARFGWVGVGLIGLAVHAVAQGPLDPSGPPGPTMKSLDQIEPRTPISAIPYRIYAPGSYYLTASLVATSASSGIYIYCTNVTIDLNGFTLANPGGAYAAIEGTSSGDGIVVRNGSVIGWALGVNCPNASCRLENVTISSNLSSVAAVRVGDQSVVSGCRVTDVGSGFNGVGIYVGNRCRIIDCQVVNTASDGLHCGEDAKVERCAVRNCFVGIFAGARATVRACSAVGNKSSGVFVCSAGGMIQQVSAYSNNSEGIAVGDFCVVEQCTSVSNGFAREGHGSGILAGTGCVLKDNTVAGNCLNGISAFDNATVANCSATFNSLDGIWVRQNAIVANCSAAQNGADGINADLSANVAHCTAVQNSQDGIRVGQNATVTSCAAYSNGWNGIVGTCNTSVKGCTAQLNGRSGIVGSQAAIVERCSAMQNNWNGIDVSDTSSVEGCAVRGNGMDGIRATYSAFIRNNGCDVNGSNGVHVLNFNNRIDNNNLTGNYTGLRVDVAGNVVIRNSARGNWGAGGNFNIASGNDVGPIGQAATATSPWANISN